MERCKLLITAAVIIVLIASIIACSPDQQVVTNEVTREIPVTVETVHTIEVTREVPVTVETIRQIKVTRIAEAIREIAVTREVPVTRLVEVGPTKPAEPLSDTSTSTPIPPTATPVVTPHAPTPAPTTTPAIIPTPTPDSVQTYGNWQMRSEPVRIGYSTIIHFENIARKWEAGVDAPILTFECDSSQQRSLYVDWHIALSTEAAHFPRYTDDPFRQYQDEDLDALIDLTRQLLAFVDEPEISRIAVRKREQLWKSLLKNRNLDPDTATELVKRMDGRNHRSVVIAAEFYIHNPDHPAGQKYGPVYLEHITGDWVVLPGHRTQMNAANVGSLKQAYRNVVGASSGNKTDHIMVARVQRPEQVGSIVAEWEITGLDRVINHCKTIRP